MKEKIKVAHVINKLTTGGIKSYVLNYCRKTGENVDNHFIVCVRRKGEKDYADLGGMGITVHEVAPVSRPFSFMKECAEVFSKNAFDVVVSHIGTLNVLSLKAAKKAGVKVRVSDNLSTSHRGEIKDAVKSVLKLFTFKSPTHYAGNSLLSAKWLFGSKRLDKCLIFRNAMDLDNFLFDEEKKKGVREKFGIDKDAFLIGNVGRFCFQKNHLFLIDVFNEVSKRDENARLMLIGYGKLRDKIFAKIDALGLKDKVIDVGLDEDLPKYYSAMDLFLLPSLYEGLPVVGIEAQAAGLPVVYSDEITKEAGITEQTAFVSLKEPISVWADKILSFKGTERKNNYELLKAAGYDIYTEVKKLEKFYEDALKEASQGKRDKNK